MKMAIGIGDTAPDFSLPCTNGSTFVLSEEVKNGPVLLNFYVGDFGINCTNYMTKFCERIQEMDDLGVRTVGINDNSMDSHTGFRKAIGLKWELLFDKDKEVAKAYGAIVGPGHMVTGFTNREFILVDGEMKVRFVWRSSVPKELPVFDDILDGVKSAIQ